MILRTTLLSVSGFTALALTTGVPAHAGDANSLAYATPAQVCTGSGHGGTTINNYNKKTINTYNNKTINNYNKNITINKPITVNKNININKSFDFSKNIVINKPVTITKNIDLSKNINIEKNVNIEKNIDLSKNIVINKNVNVDVEANAFAFAHSEAAAATFVRSGGGSITVINQGGGLGEITVAAPEVPCIVQWATVVKSIHAVCVDKSGKEHPAVRMRKETWIDSSMDKEIYRCLEGSTLKVVIGDVVQSNKGLAGAHQGKVFECRPGEALRHFKDGVVKCVAAEKVPDCTERENLRKHGIGTMFFSYPAKVCVPPAVIAEKHKQAPRPPYTRRPEQLPPVDLKAPEEAPEDLKAPEEELEEPEALKLSDLNGGVGTAE